jgi:transcription-repair coupling factor (superfamily II helicase)
VSLRGLTERIQRSAAFKRFADDVLAGGWSGGCALPRVSRPYLAAALQLQSRRTLVYVTASVEQSRFVADALTQLTGIEALRFAEPNTAFYDTVAPVRDVIAQRSNALAMLARTDAACVIVASPRALMHPTLAGKSHNAGTRTIALDQTLPLDQMLAHWVSSGYENEPVVDRVGTFSRRGGIVDVWPPTAPAPVRIELFGNIADSIREFDPGTQRSGQSLRSVTITPLDAAQEHATATLLDHLPPDALLIIDDEAELHDAWRALEDRAKRELETLAASDDPDNAPPRPARTPYIAWGAFETAASAHATGALVLGQTLAEGSSAGHPITRNIAQAPHFAGTLSPLMDYLSTTHADAASAQATVVVSRQSARMAELWSERQRTLAAGTAIDEPPERGLWFTIGALPGGFIWKDGTPDGAAMAILTDAEIFGQLRPEAFSRGRVRKNAPEKAFADWRTGDAVVHEDYGVGLFRGLVKLTVNTASPTAPSQSVEAEREYLLLEYEDADRLYVPLHQLDRVQRYVGGEEDKPRLDKLHSGEWEKKRSKASGAVVDIAHDMLTLYAAREVAKGHAFGHDTAWQTELESSFPFVETEDQLRAIEAVKADMESSTPMDRLVVGDVGFGKTEVALRAAFKAVQDGKQVAVLVPTTVLAQQHWNTFNKRMGAFPIAIEMHSRFRTAAEKREIVEKLADGQIDIVIGTHGLVSDKVRFKQLGLLIIDEEHRFGVTAKEKLKQLRTEVDVLTLSATPIPRTLYMGLSGVRAISKIETPPAERLPIINYVGGWDDTVVQQAIRRELDRDGQVFIVHNRIQSIGLLASKLERLVPEASMSVAHGQMDEHALARIMVNFADGKVDILLCTNIIESGLDIPNANTIIIDAADHFGLAELHQLRGRVGRSTIQAYAYFLHDRRARMTAEARERLETLRETAGIGAGYAISMRDLEMRGAGDILGAKQSGHITNVGFDLYTRLLAFEVAKLRAMRDGQPLPAPPPKPVVIDLPLTIGLPESYINDESLRVQLYRRVSSLDSAEAIQAFEEELTDRFGKLPAAALNLTYQVRLKLLALKLGANAITTEGNKFTIRADALERLVPQVRAVQQLLGPDALIGRRQVAFLRRGTPEQWKARLMDVIARLIAMIDAQPAPRSPARHTPATDVFADDGPKSVPIAKDNDW